MIPEMACIVEIDNEMAGAVFSIPDYNPRIKRIDGRLFPFGLWHLLRNKRAIKKVRNIASNVLPKYQLMGLVLVLAKEMILRGTAGGIEDIEFSWVAESNHRSRGSLEKVGAKRDKTYRVYDWDPA